MRYILRVCVRHGEQSFSKPQGEGETLEEWRRTHERAKENGSLIDNVSAFIVLDDVGCLVLYIQVPEQLNTFYDELSIDNEVMLQIDSLSNLAEQVQRINNAPNN